MPRKSAAKFVIQWQREEFEKDAVFGETFFEKYFSGFDKAQFNEKEFCLRFLSFNVEASLEFFKYKYG